MSWSLRIRLSAMMFLEFAIWGAWTPVLYPHLKAMGFGPFQTTWIFSALWLACIVAPFIGGQIVDRWFPTQWFLAAVHLVGGLLLLLMTQQASFPGLMTIMLLYSLLYAPTLALTASLCFHHLTDAAERSWSRPPWRQTKTRLRFRLRSLRSSPKIPPRIRAPGSPRHRQPKHPNGHSPRNRSAGATCW